MANLFDSTNYPQSEPDTLTAGDRWTWKRTDLGSDYPPASYALSYVARLEGTGATTFTIACSESGSDYLAEVAAATTVAYTVGSYRWDAYVTRSSDDERIRIATGTWEVKADLATDTSDPRSHARKVLDAIESVIEGKATADVASYSLGGRSITKLTPRELSEWRRLYEDEVAKETTEQEATRGKKGKYSIGVRMQ